MNHNQSDTDNINEDTTTKANETSSNKKTFEVVDKNDSEERFQDGELLSMVRVRFPGNAKSQPFLLGKRKFVYGQKVLAMSDRGMTVGYINSFPYEVNFDKSMLPIRTISKVASDEDVIEQKSYMQKEKDAEVLCIRLIEKYNLDMNVTHVEFIQFGKKAVFYFNAPERVDFRNLVKDLVGDLKMRIELRQISVRDRAAALGAIGACGLQTCCSSFLSNYGNVSIKMAKNQNLALIPAKINGVCGQVKCCIKYEDDVYTEKRRMLPSEQSFIRALNGDTGKVIKLHLMQEQFDMLTDRGNIRRYAKSQFNEKDCHPAKGWEFPHQFRSIVSETSTVIGDSEEDRIKMKKYAIERDENDTEGEELYLEDDSNEVVIEDVDVTNSRKSVDSSEESNDSRRPSNNNRNRPNNKNRNNNNRNRPNNNNRDKQTAGPQSQAPRTATSSPNTTATAAKNENSQNPNKKRYTRNKKKAPKNET